MTGLRNLCRVLLLQLVLCGTGIAQSPTPFPIIKLGVDKSGVYKLDYNMLTSAGFAPDGIDPQQLQMLTMQTGMLLQSNSGMPALESVAIQVVGGSDGRFDREDVVIFYAQGPDRVKYVSEKGLYSYQNNLYSDLNYYFLTVGLVGDMVVKIPASTGNAVTITEFVDCSIYESDLYNDQKSGRDWVGEIMDTRPELTIRFGIPGIVPNSPIKVVTSLMAQSYSPSSIKVSWNNVQMMDEPMPTIPATQYGLKGAKRADTLTTSADIVQASGVSDQDIKISFTKAATGRSVAFLDYVMLNVKRTLAWYGSPTIFTIPSTSGEAADLLMAGAPADAIVWDVTNPQGPFELTTTFEQNGLRFGTSTSATRTFVAFQPGKLPAPLTIKLVDDLNSLHSSPVPNLLIVAFPGFITEAERLAAHRRTVYGIDVLVTTPEQVYNEFSGGRQDVSSIRNCTRYLFEKEAGKLRNLLLFGRGSYDYKNRVINNSNYVPTYESVNSLSPLETYSSDDFYALLESHEGEWGESPAANSTLDIGVGRIPVRTVEEAAIVVDKLIAYDTDNSRFGGWRKDVLFVADDGDWNIHQGDADELAEDIEVDYLRLHTRKLYLDSYEQEQNPNGQRSAAATDALFGELNRGYAIVNYTGHGNEHVWMDERVLDQDTPFDLPNNPKQPLFVTATCEFGRNDNPLLISTAEYLLLKKKGGAIGLVTTARPVHSTTNFSLNKAFYSSLFNVSNGAKDLGTIFMETKNNSLSGISNRNFSLLGDPSMRFGLQPEELVATSFSTLSGSDTLKALSEVIVEGEVRIGANVSTDFNGVVEISLYDKRATLVTLGDENEPFTYKNWSNMLFRGKATVQDGRFIHAFRLPANLAPEIGNGKLSMYAFSTDKKKEVTGTALNIKIGGTEPNPGSDSSGPEIELFIGDTTFLNGGFANNDTWLVAKLGDNSGINTSGYTPDGVTANLDETEQYSLNDYYVADIDDPTHGTVTFPLNDLEPGPHRITFVAYDNFGNMSTSTVDFVIGEDNQIVIEEFLGYPNPFSNDKPTTFQFTHSRAGDDLEAQLLIYNSMGQLTAQMDYFVPSSEYRVTLAEWDGLSTFGVKMSDGIYLAKLSVRSLSDGAKNAKIAKLILAN